MFNNYIQHQYQPYHKIYTHQQSHFSIFLGDVSSALDMEFIKTEHINLVITAASGMDQVSYPNGEAKHHIYPLLDAKSQNIAQFFLDFYDLVEKEILGGNILVHCAAGISRSATLVIAYFMKKFNWTFKEAIKFVRDKRPVVLPNLGFQRQLKEFEITMNSKSSKQQNRIAQSSQLDKRIDYTKNIDERRGLFSPIKRQLLPNIKYPSTLIRSKELQKNPRFVSKDYIVEIAHKQIDLQIKKSDNKTNSKNNLKKSSARPINASKELLISKIQSGRTKILERSTNFDPIRSPGKNDRVDTFYQPELKVKKLSSLSHRNELYNKGIKIPRNYSNNSKRGDCFIPLYDQVNHVVVSKLQLNERRFVTQKQLRSRGVQRLIKI